MVSAMGKETDELIALANAVSKTAARPGDGHAAHGRGAQGMALLCMALADLGVDGVSFTGSQVGHHHRRRAHEGQDPRGRRRPGPGCHRRRARCRVVAGFQGVSDRPRDHHPRPWRSDTTAVALAAAFKADACEIYTDVTGRLHGRPPDRAPGPQAAARHFDEMLEMAATGGRVLALRSVEFARNYNVPLHVRSSFTWEPGTWVIEEEPTMEEPIISGVTHDISEAKVTITGVPDRPPTCSTPIHPELTIMLR